jgi:hypothetical protein
MTDATAQIRLAGTHTLEDIASPQLRKAHIRCTRFTPPLFAAEYCARALVLTSTA